MIELQNGSIADKLSTIKKVRKSDVLVYNYLTTQVNSNGVLIYGNGFVNKMCTTLGYSKGTVYMSLRHLRNLGIIAFKPEKSYIEILDESLSDGANSIIVVETLDDNDDVDEHKDIKHELEATKKIIARLDPSILFDFANRTVAYNVASVELAYLMLNSMTDNFEPEKIDDFSTTLKNLADSVNASIEGVNSVVSLVSNDWASTLGEFNMPDDEPNVRITSEQSLRLLDALDDVSKDAK